MESDNNTNSNDANLWMHHNHHQQQPIDPNDDQNKQFYRPPYQPMQHGFDLQHEIKMQQMSSSHPDNVHHHYMRDTNGGIYYFDQRDNYVFMNNADVFNSYMPPNTQPPFQHQPQPMMQQAPPKHNNSSSVIHHLVASNLGPGKFNTFGGSGHNNFYDPTMSNTSSAPPLNISIPSLLEHVKSTPDILPSSTDKSMPLLSTTNNSENITPNMQHNNKKQRIVAEVKPMRMSYSDVVSKNAAINGNSQVPHSSNSSSSSPNTTMPVAKNMKSEKVKYDKKFEIDKNRKSPTTIGNMEGTFKRSPPGSTVKQEKPSTPPSVPKQLNTSSGAKKRKLQNSKDPNSSDSKNVRQEKSVHHHKYITDSERSSTIGSDEEICDDDDDNEELESLDGNEYCVRKNVYQGEHHKVEKIRPAGYKKSSKQQSTSQQPSSSSKKNERVQKRASGKTSRKQKHEFIQKILASCLEYVLAFAKWLWMLVYDVGYMSFGIIWDRLSWGFSYVQQGVLYARRELHGNPGRALFAWLKNVWKKFDSKFAKKSKWAFWRYMFKRQLGSEGLKDAYKDGKLPKTAEEAMTSLLNCKEKDAYSILGVSPDCPQEQIKKHYKKIAVLVHPDKNKQAGAEEAFKVLQRSFELIGEQESRKQYDENLAKALHTEKAFNELNDLLIQLQTKISEAANTIRCSSCCFRHPRKLTGRKPFAARECKTCKIRHAGREGDIWAETSFCGLRWKYLALMEGNVYDITEWALCQRGALSHIQANSCVVQYKIVLGGNQQQHHQQARGSSTDRFKKDTPQSENIVDDFIYAGQQQHTNNQSTTRRRHKKN